MKYSPVKLEGAYKLKANDSPEDQLSQLLTTFGLKGDVPFNDHKEVDLIELLELIPEKLESEENPVYRELSEYIAAIPPRRRRAGIVIHAEPVLNLLMERLEFFEGLSRSMVRMCSGRACPHYNVCPFKEVVRDISVDESIPCAVEREIIRNAVESFVYPTGGHAPKVDPRRPEMGLLFKQLAHLLVNEARLSMHLQTDDVTVQVWEALRDDQGAESFQSMNKGINPLVDAWMKNHTAIQKTMKEMGLSPEFQIRQGLWVDESSRIDAERRAIELATEFIRDGALKQLRQLPPGDPKRESLEEAIAHANAELKALKENT